MEKVSWNVYRGRLGQNKYMQFLVHGYRGRVVLCW